MSRRVKWDSQHRRSRLYKAVGFSVSQGRLNQADRQAKKEIKARDWGLVKARLLADLKAQGKLKKRREDVNDWAGLNLFGADLRYAQVRHTTEVG